ncbi:Cl-channel protein [Athelia psychrophila]|uniref:Chloride channel protein n=1 Tax=Athelia psychrophila TaxID=1759441 RepID=A0A166JNS1_9AGAM|nr:Cl-channel protein [Fibularhizoctonia sp. CBS 109695]
MSQVSSEPPRGITDHATTHPPQRANEFYHDAESLELSEFGELLVPSRKLGQGSAQEQPNYQDGNSIDWLREESAERERVRLLHSHRGLRGLLLPFWDASSMWFVIVLTGIGIGVTGAWLDVLVKWLADLREGRCDHGFFYNQPTCCSGFDAGEICTDWKTWGEFLSIRFILGQSLLHSFVYVTLAVLFAGISAILVKSYAPYAFHTGIPEIKAILGGYVLDRFLSPWTLLIKSLGLALAVASGLSLGKEGPLVHVACCMAFLLSKLFKQFRNNEAQKRRLLAAAAAAGVSVAFGSPLGGVLFGLEELDTFSNESDVMWRGFVTSVIAAMSLQYVDPFGTKKLVLFQVTSAAGDKWRAFELVPWTILAVAGGVLGSFLIKMNVMVAVYRRNSALNDWPVLEVVFASAITAAVSYLVVFSRVQTSELVANLFQECDINKADYHGLCNPTAMWENVFLLVVTALMKMALTAWTFGMMVPAGIFLPTIAIGASLGRAVGLLTQGLHRAYPTAWVFAACPADLTVRCVSPGFYAVIGASAMLAGVTRMTISLVVILFELTGALSHVLPIMISVVISKWVADAFGKDGIYGVWIAMRKYPCLPPIHYRDKGETAAHIMTPVERLVVLQDGCTLRDIDDLVKKHKYHGFPVLHGAELVGYVTRDKLMMAIEGLFSEDPMPSPERQCSFSDQPPGEEGDFEVLSGLLEAATMQLRKELPQELVVNMFQKLNLRYIMFTHEGKLTGMVNKTDIVSLLHMDFQHTAALSTPP